MIQLINRSSSSDAYDIYCELYQADNGDDKLHDLRINMMQSTALFEIPNIVRAANSMPPTYLLGHLRLVTRGCYND